MRLPNGYSKAFVNNVWTLVLRIYGLKLAFWSWNDTLHPCLKKNEFAIGNDVMKVYSR